MKFSDLFLPKHVRSDPEVRKHAVEKMKDQSLLSQIAENDPDETVRDLASSRVSDLTQSKAA